MATMATTMPYASRGMAETIQQVLHGRELCRTNIPIKDPTIHGDSPQHNDKFGGAASYVDSMDDWPTCEHCEQAMDFIFQLTDPTTTASGSSAIQLYLCPDDTSDCCINNNGYYCIRHVQYNTSGIYFRSNPERGDRPCSDVSGWTVAEEYKTIPSDDALFNPTSEFLAQINTPIPSYYAGSMRNFFVDSVQMATTPYVGVKFHGTPYSCQGYPYTDSILQVAEEEWCAYGWGDEGVAHIFRDDTLKWDCC